MPNEVLDHFDVPLFELTDLGYWSIDGQTLCETRFEMIFKRLFSTTEFSKSAIYCKSVHSEWTILSIPYSVRSPNFRVVAPEHFLEQD